MKRDKRIIVTIMVLLVLCLVLTACNNNGNSYTKKYKPVIADWKAAYENVKNGGDPYGDGFSFGFYDMSGIASAKAYYAYYDIDGNGTPELILKKGSDYEDIIAYIFSIKDGKAVNIFGYDEVGNPIEVPWSRVGSGAILSNGLIDCMTGSYALYRISDDGFTAAKIAYKEPFNYPDEASLDEAEWRYFVNNVQVEYDEYVQHLSEQGYVSDGNNDPALIEWENIG